MQHGCLLMKNKVMGSDLIYSMDDDLDDKLDIELCLFINMNLVWNIENYFS